MQTTLKIKSFLFIMLLSIASAYASETREAMYEKLAIVVKIPSPEDRNNIFRAGLNVNKEREIKSLISRHPEVNFERYKSDQYHISLECFNYNKPQNKRLHTRFGSNQVNFLHNINENFPKGSYKEAICYDMQLWCHSVKPNSDNLHFYFSNKKNDEEKIEDIKNLNTVLEKTTIDSAHLILRVGTHGKLRDN